MRRLAVDQGRWKEFVEAPLTLWGTMGKRKRKKIWKQEKSPHLVAGWEGVSPVMGLPSHSFCTSWVVLHFLSTTWNDYNDQPRGKRSLGRPMKRWHENPLLRS
jgi:hypothetical protein